MCNATNARAAIGNGMSSYRVMWELQGRRCFHCGGEMGGKTFLQKRRENGYTRDHLVPRASGGGVIGNIVLAHERCNTAKAAKLPTQFDLQICKMLWAVYRHFELSQSKLVCRRKA